MTTHQGLRLATGVVVENMGTTVLVMIPGQHDVLTLTGSVADVVRAVIAGHPISPELEEAADRLIVAGVLTSPMSRRNLIRAGAIATGAGIAVFTMPSVAAAASPGGGTGSGEDPVFTFTNVIPDGSNVSGVTVVLPNLPVYADLVGGQPAWLDLALVGGTPRFFLQNSLAAVLVFTTTGTMGSPPLSAFEANSGVEFTFTFRGDNVSKGSLILTR